MDVQPLTFTSARVSAPARPQRQHRAGGAVTRRVAPHRLLPHSRRPAAHHPDYRRISARADGFGGRDARLALSRFVPHRRQPLGERMTNLRPAALRTRTQLQSPVVCRCGAAVFAVTLLLASAVSADAGLEAGAAVVGSHGAPQFHLRRPGRLHRHGFGGSRGSAGEASRPADQEVPVVGRGVQRVEAAARGAGRRRRGRIGVGQFADPLAHGHHHGGDRRAGGVGRRGEVARARSMAAASAWRSSTAALPATIRRWPTG